jgi:toxin secretion/phage lysis holin
VVTLQHIIDRKAGEGTVRHYLDQLATGFEYKIVFSLLGAIISVMGEFYGELVWGFLSLFSLDFLTGIWKSKKNGIPISSRRLRDSVTKLGAYMVLITALIIASKFENSFVPVVTVTYYYFIFTELKSIIENVEELGVPIPEFLKGKVAFKIQEYDKDESKDKKEEK